MALALIVAACGGSDEPADAPSASTTTQITGIDWELGQLTLDGTNVDLAGTTPTIAFTATDVGGTNGCNNYGGDYSVDGGTISFGAMFQTEIGCQPAVAGVESAFMTALQRIDRFDTSAGVLTLAASDGSAELVFNEPEPIVNNALQGRWLLDSIGDAVAVSSIIAGSDPTLTITDTDISGSTGCNTFSGSLEWDTDGTFRVGDMSWTEIGCEQDIMGQEQAVLETLSGAANYEIEGDKLLISTDTGDAFLRYTAN